MSIELLFFGVLSELISETSLERHLNSETTLGELRARLQEEFPSAAKALETAMAAVDTEYRSDEFALTDGATVAFLPPVSGG